MQPKKLEHYKYFQPIAWTVCISFAVFVGMLSLEMKTAVENLESSNLNTEQRLQNIEKTIGTNNASPTSEM